MESLLRDDRSREQLFDEAILLERLHYVQRQGLAEEALGAVPRKFRGLNPQQLRLPEPHMGEQAFHRRRYVHNQRTFQYFRSALEAEKTQLKTREKDNALVIRQLMAHFSEQVLAAKRGPQEQAADSLRRLFLRYANDDSEDVLRMFKTVSQANFRRFFQDFQLPLQPELQHILEQPEVSEFLFLEVVHLLSVTQGVADVPAFLQQHILSKPDKFLPREWQL